MIIKKNIKKLKVLLTEGKTDVMVIEKYTN